MKQLAILPVLQIVLATLCSCVTTPDTCDRSVDLPPCVDCGPGAVRSGRFFCPDFPTVMTSDGQLVRNVVNELEWLDGTFAVTRSLSLDAGNYGAQIAFDAGGEVARIDTPGSHDHALSIKMFDTHGAALWRTDFGTVPLETLGDVALGPDKVFFARRDSQLDPQTHMYMTTGTLSAYDRASGALAWMLPIEVERVIADPSGGVLVVGGFTGTLALGGTAPPLTTTSSSGATYVAALDAAGAGRWAIQPNFVGSIGLVTRGASGRIALTSFGIASASTRVALLDDTGKLLWVNSLPVGDMPISLVIDGDAVITGGTSLDIVTATSVRPVPVAATSTGVRAFSVLGLPAPDSIVASVGSIPTFNDSDNTWGPPPTMTFDGKELHGTGAALVVLAR